MSVIVTGGSAPSRVSPPVASGPSRGAVPPQGGRARSSTPAKFRMLLGCLVVATLLWGAAAAWTVYGRAQGVDNLLARSEPLAVNVTELYGALQDADASAASSFLTLQSGAGDMRQRYEEDIAQAGTTLSAISTSGDPTAAVAMDLSVISTQLPVYTGIVERARSENAQGLLLGAGYQRDASTLMYGRLLPAAANLYTVETAALNSDHNDAVAAPIAVLAVGPVALIALVGGQIFLARRTRRRFNVGLLVTTLATVAAIVWVGLGLAAEAGAVTRSSQEGSAPVEVLTQARITALQARGDELLTLVSRGEDPLVPGVNARSLYEQNLEGAVIQLAGDDGDGGLLGQARTLAWDGSEQNLVATATAAFKSWSTQHTSSIVPEESSGSVGQTHQAITLATTTSAASFAALDENLVAATDHARASFDSSAAEGRDDLSGMLYGVIALAALAAAAAAVGIDRRLQDYR